jgi:hypothetical protein
VPPRVAKAELGSTTAPKTTLAAIEIPTQTASTTVEWPSAKKNPVPSGRRPSAISFLVTLSMAEM